MTLAPAPGLRPSLLRQQTVQRAGIFAFGLMLVLLAVIVWGAALFASLSGAVGERMTGAELAAQAARREASALLARRDQERTGRVTADRARLAALAAEESNASPRGDQLAEAVGFADGPSGRKEAFIKIVLPLILAENARISDERHRFESMRRTKADIGEADLFWLRAMAADYDLSDDLAPADILEELLPKVDIIPVSMAIGQAAEESGWGTSRPAQGQNALFGLQTMAIGGIVSAPVATRDGRLKNASFEHLRQCVTAYMHTINSRRPYSEFRAARAERRAQGKSLDGAMLISHLTRYSELGVDYTRKIQALIRRNRLDLLDHQASLPKSALR
jgi:Bax protein